MSILGNFGRLQAVRRSLQQVLRPLEPHLTVPVSISQARTRIMPPPYREEVNVSHTFAVLADIDLSVWVESAREGDGKNQRC